MRRERPWPPELQTGRGHVHSGEFFSHAFVDGRLVVVINQAHPFYKKVYAPLAESQQARDRDIRIQMEVLLLAAARAAAVISTKTSDAVLEKYRSEWSETLAAFLNG